MSLVTRNERTQEELDLIERNRNMIEFLRNTAAEIEQSGEMCTNVLVVLKTYCPKHNMLNVDVRSLSDDDADLALLARANDMILHRQ